MSKSYLMKYNINKECIKKNGDSYLKCYKLVRTNEPTVRVEGNNYIFNNKTFYKK